MSENAPAYNAPALLITTDDGTLLSCEVHEMGGARLPRQLRWRVLDAQGNMYAGPLYRDGASPQAVRWLVATWWELRKAGATQPAGREPDGRTLIACSFEDAK